MLGSSCLPRIRSGACARASAVSRLLACGAVRHLHSSGAFTSAAASTAASPASRAPLARSSSPFDALRGRAFSSSSNHDSSHHRQPTSRVSGLDYYALLEVHRYQLEPADLKAAYYRLAKQYHPDRLMHLSEADRLRAEKRFAAIGVAYSVLGDPVKRQQYDIFMDLSSVGDQDRMLHWVKINRPPEQLGFEGFTPAYEAGYDKKQPTNGAAAGANNAAATAAGDAAKKSGKPRVILPVFRSS